MNETGFVPRVRRVAAATMTPAMRLMNGLSYAKKFALISFLFIIPLALNMYLLGSEIDERIQFAEKEILGTAYLRPLHDLQIRMEEDRAVDISEYVAKLADVDRRLGNALQTTKPYGALAEAWRTASGAGVDHLQTEAVRQWLLKDIKTLRRDVGDSSNLILDPDLDTYYLMDATLLTLPEVETVLGDLLRKPKPVMSDAQSMWAARAELIRIGGQIKIASDVVQHGIDVASTHNASGMVATRLTKPLQEYVSAMNVFVETIDTVTADDTFLARHDELKMSALATLQSAHALWAEAIDELDELLEIRIARFASQERLVYVVAVCTLALVAYLLFAFYLAVARTVKGLGAATERLLTGDLDTPIDTVAQDELGQLVGSFDDLARRLRVEWTQARAEAKRALEAESRVREGEARNQVVLESALDAVVTINAAGELTWWNGQAQKMYGLTHEALGKPAADLLLAESHRDAFRRFLETPVGPAHNQRIEVTAVRSGQEFPIELSITMAQSRNGDCTFSAFIRDITRRKKMEVELRQAQKLESVGRLAAGVAHEINTPVQFVSDNMHFLKGGLSDLCEVMEKYQALRQSVVKDLPHTEAATAIERAEHDADLEYLIENMPTAVERSIEGLERVAAIVRSMKEFAHPDQKEMTTVDLNQAIASTLVIARNEYKYVADVDTDFGGLPRVLCHAGEVNQAVLNIIVNAAHAIGDVVAGTEKRGRITIRTRHDRKWAEVTIADTGGGIPDAVRDRVFDPFFTTKEVGKGTGQGLAIARNVILEKHGGTLTFETEPGVGTTFVIRLPIDGRGAIKDAA